MNCYYHTDRNAVLHCPKCNKELCDNCFHIFKSNFCIECEEEIATNKLKKSTIIVLSSIVIFVIIYLLFKYAIYINKSLDDFVNLFGNVAKEILKFPNVIAKAMGSDKVIISDLLANRLYIFLLTYVFSCIPCTWYSINKLLKWYFSGNIILLFVMIVLKFEISIIAGPIIMPIIMGVSIVSIIKNIRRLKKVREGYKCYSIERISEGD